MSMQEESEILKVYEREIRQTPLLEQEEFLELIKMVEEGAGARKNYQKAKNNRFLPGGVREKFRLKTIAKPSSEAKKKIAQANLRLVPPIARQYQKKYPSASLLDLIEEGNLGLFRAIDKFERKRGKRLSTYATWWIRQFIQRALCDKERAIKIPVGIIRLISKYRAVKNRLENELGGKATIEEIAFAMNMTVERLQTVKRVAAGVSSLEAMVWDDSETPTRDLVADKKEKDPLELNCLLNLGEDLQKAFRCLDPREKKIISLRYGLDNDKPKPLRKIAEEFGLTKERVRQIIETSLEKLRKNQTIKGLK